MEEVPDLVFLNCCHLGALERAPENFDRLSYSMAKALIEIGVRGVIVAGWAVDDRARRGFARTFYEGFVGRNLPFGDAVFAARETVYDDLADVDDLGRLSGLRRAQLAVRSGGRRDARRLRNPQAPGDWVAVEELLVELLGWPNPRGKRATPTPTRIARASRRGSRASSNKLPKDWRLTASVQAAAGKAYFELGDRFFETARQHYIFGLGLEGGEQPASVAIIEQLANLEARLADDDGIEPSRAGALIDTAIARIDGLLALASSGDSMRFAPPVAPRTSRDTRQRVQVQGRIARSSDPPDQIRPETRSAIRRRPCQEPRCVRIGERVARRSELRHLFGIECPVPASVAVAAKPGVAAFQSHRQGDCRRMHATRARVVRARSDVLERDHSRRCAACAADRRPFAGDRVRLSRRGRRASRRRIATPCRASPRASGSSIRRAGKCARWQPSSTRCRKTRRWRRGPEPRRKPSMS